LLSFYQKYWRTAFDIALIVITVLLIMWSFSFIYNIAKPIFYSFIIFLCIEPLAKRLQRIGLKKSIASAISIVLFTLIVLGLICGLVFVAFGQVSDLITRFPYYQETLSTQVTNLGGLLQHYIDQLPFEIEIAKDIEEPIKKIASTLQTWLLGLLSFLVGSVTSLTSFLINVAIGLILAYFLSIEIVDWRKIATEKTPNTFKTAFFFLRDNVLKGIWVYIKAQAKLISVTFIVILATLLILGVQHALAISLLAALFDILPLLGVSTVFIPWITYLFIIGDYQIAIWLTVLWLVVIITRQLLEPKITGDSLGVSAFTMLAFMIISLSVFGVAGMILSPILVILVKALYEQGYFKQWIRKPIGEYDNEEIK